MKKLIPIALLSILGFSIGKLNAQSTTSNNTFSGSGSPYIGWDNTSNLSLDVKTNTAFPIKFFTNTTEKMRILSTGEVGIGTPTPGAWLQVNSSGTTDVFKTNVQGSFDSYWRMNQAGTEYGRLEHLLTGSDFYVTATRGHLRFQSGSGISTQYPAIQINGTTTNSGFVGIGDYTSFSPTRRLNVYDSNVPQFRISNDATSTVYTDFQTLSSGDLYINPMNGSTPKGVGIGTSTIPATTKVEVDASIPSFASTAEALRLKSIQTNVTNNYVARIIGQGGNSSLTGLDIGLLQGSGFSYGININNKCSGGPSVTNYGIYGIINGPGGVGNVGITVYAQEAYGINTGGEFHADNLTTAPGNSNYGIMADASNAYSICGVFGTGLNGGGSTTGVTGVASSATGNVYGVFAEASGSSAYTYGIFARGPAAGTNCPGGVGGMSSCAKAAGYFDGDIGSTGLLYNTSDQKLKKNILDAPSTMSIINALHPKTFDFDSAGFPSMNLPRGNHYGLIAQEVEQILPNLIKNLGQPAITDSVGNVTTPSVDFLGMNYIELIPIMLKGMQEQQLTIDSLRNVLGGNPRPSNPVNPNSQKIELSDKQGIIINQNDPNPWSESTTITYSIPTSVREAKIMFTDNKGTVLRSAKIESRGEGSLEVYASELSSGIYTYTLICDGKVIESKKMMKK